MKAIPEARRVH